MRVMSVVTVVGFVSSRPACRGGIGSEGTVVSLRSAENRSTLATHKDIRVVGNERLTFWSVTGRPVHSQRAVLLFIDRSKRTRWRWDVYRLSNKKTRGTERTYMIAASLPPTIRLALTP